MSQTEIRVVPGYKWRMTLLAFVAAGAFYYLTGYVPVIIWVGIGTLGVFLLFGLIRGEGKDPVIILNDEGVFDKRLRVGTIEWSDIRRIRSYNLHGAAYISLELHDVNRYESRRPTWFKLLLQVQRVFGMSSIAISTNGLDMDQTTLWQMLHDGCAATAESPQIQEEQ